MQTASEQLAEHPLLVTTPTPSDGISRQSEIEGILDSPLKGLKAIILSLEWELSKKTLKELDDEIIVLEEIWKAEKTFLIFLRILRSLGKYIDSAQAKAHPDSIKLLFAVYNDLEKTFLSTKMSLEEKAAVAFNNGKRYNELRLQINALNNAKRNPHKEEEKTGQFSPETPNSAPDEATQDTGTKQNDLDDNQEIVPALAHLEPLPEDKTHTRFEEALPDVENCLDDFFNADMPEEETAEKTCSARDETPTQSAPATLGKEQTNDQLSDNFLEEAESQLDVFFHEKPREKVSSASPAMSEEPLQSVEAPAEENVETPSKEINEQQLAYQEPSADDVLQAPKRRQKKTAHLSPGDLNSIIERINDHIDGYTRKRLHEEVQSLQKVCGNDSGMHLLLEALDITGEHIFIKGHQAEKRLVSLFHSIHESIKDLLSMPEDKVADTPDTIYRTIHAYMAFQSQLVLPELAKVAEDERKRKENDNIKVSISENDNNSRKPTLWKAVRTFVGLQQ